MKEIAIIISILIGIIIIKNVIEKLIKKRDYQKIKKQVEIERNSKEYIENQLNKINQTTIENTQSQQKTYYPYHKKYLLTKNEYYFYKKLKTITDKNNIQILAKIRLADLIQVNAGMSNSEHMRYWGKIQAKHIDFAIVDDMKVIMLVELQDGSHKDPDRIESDNFKREVLTQCGYLLINTYGETQTIENAIANR